MADERKGLSVFQRALGALERSAVTARRSRGLHASRREAARQASELGTRLDARRIGDWLNPGDGRAPHDPDQVWALVQVWRAWEGKKPEPREREDWNALVEAAQPRRPAARPSRHVGPGRPIREWTPRELNVTPAIEGIGSPLPFLPAYVRRAHDAVLERLVATVEDDAVMAVLVGDASTGKTRALWEVLGALPDGWRLWFPAGPDRPESVLKGLPDVEPRTVVWLDDLQRHLLTPGKKDGERVAAGLSALLGDRRRGPVLVLGTIWPGDWATLFGYASPYEDPYLEARALLSQRDVPVPAMFPRPDLDRARAAAAGDPRLAEAVKHAEDGHLTQYLAGGPALRAVYLHSPDPAARALMDAAIDARRLGHGPMLPKALLSEAVHGYLTRPQWDRLTKDWQERAFRYVTDDGPCRGARAPLTLVRVLPDEDGEWDSCVRLADYLEQFGRNQRRTEPVPKALWDGLMRYAQGSDLVKLGRQAQERGLYRYALWFYAEAFEADPRATDAMLWSGDLHAIASRLDNALHCYRRAAENGDEYGWVKGVRLLLEAGRSDEAVRWSYEAVWAEALDAAAQVADLLGDAGHELTAMEILRRAADAGSAEAAAWIGEILNDSEPEPDAIGYLRIAAEGGYEFALRIVAERLVQDEGMDAAVAWLRRTPNGAAAIAELRHAEGNLTGAISAVLPLCEDDPTLVRLAGPWLVAADRTDEAIALYQRVVALGGAETPREATVRESAVRNAAELLHGTARTREAFDWLFSLAEHGDPVALDQAERLALRTQSEDVLIAWLRPRAEAGDSAAVLSLAGVLHGIGRTDEAIEVCAGHDSAAVLQHRGDLLVHRGEKSAGIACYREAAELGDAQAIGLAATLERDEGRIEEAVLWTQARVAAGAGEVALRWTIDLLLGEDRTDEAIDWLRIRVLEGDVDALGWLANLLRDEGHTQEALAYYLQLAESGRAAPETDAPDAGALAQAARMLRGAGRDGEAERLVRYGVEPGGRIAGAQ
ncbi:tetratricopeptide repeat protein [Spirillospora albida]|uniref:tetratricopeptide repeat protein n=1 Tax=Spirillospora albida TaxID=58123 RepID=UPI0004C17B84|nr:hypothetical protein [Spirillospora albida]